MLLRHVSKSNFGTSSGTSAALNQITATLSSLLNNDPTNKNN